MDTMASDAVGKNTPAIPDVFRRINELQQRGLIGEYSVGGAFAFIYYAEPFETRDLDVFAHLPQLGLLVTLEPIYDYLKQLGYPFEDECVRIEGVPVQFLPAIGDALVEEAVRDAIAIEVAGVPTRIFTMEHAVAIALKTYRAKDRMKILHLWETGIRRPDASRLESILRRNALWEKWQKFARENELG